MNQKETNQLKDRLAEFGTVEQCEAKDGKFFVRISGCSANARKVVSMGSIVLNAVGHMYPTLDASQNDDGFFHLTLRPRS